MWVRFDIDNTNVGGTATSVLQIAVPGGDTPTAIAVCAAFVNDAGAGFALGIAQLAGSVIQIAKNPVTNWMLTSST